MPKPTRRAPVKSSSKTAKTTKKTAKTTKKAKTTKAATTVTKADEAAYLEMLVKTGQAVPAGRGKLPPGATHVIVPDDQGKVKAVRRRYSIS